MAIAASLRVRARGDAGHTRCKTIAATAHCLNELGIARVRLDLAPQPADLIVDRAIKQMRGAPLHKIEQQIAIHHLLRIVEQRTQQPELGGG